MKQQTIDFHRVAKEYDAGLRFNQGIGLYDTVQTNENFFIGKQWEGVQSNGLPTPVFNFLKRAVLFSVANISADNLKLHAKPLSGSGQFVPAVLEVYSSILNDQFSALFEYNRMGRLIRSFCRNAAVDGDGCLFTWWDADAEIGQGHRGMPRTELLQNTQVIFGDPNDREVQSQPYIILERRMPVAQCRRYAAALGHRDTDDITADSKESGDAAMDQLGGEKVTVLLRLWKDEESGSVHCYECTRKVQLRGEWDLGIDVYPLVWMPWDYVQDCYHGQAMITGLIPNQVFVNKLFAMSMISLMTLAYPKVVYDKTRVSKWSARVGAAIGVNGSVEGVAKIIDPASVSPQIGQFIELAVSYTQKFLGASSVVLGESRPDNASAIIALQRAAITPMELNKQNLLQCIEQQGRIYAAFMAAYYGRRRVELTLPGQAERRLLQFDFSILNELPCAIDLDAGASSYWSEIANMQTLDNLLMQGKISTSEYLRRLPAGQISDREALISVTEAAERGEAEAQTAAPLPGARGQKALQRKLRENVYAKLEV